MSAAYSPAEFAHLLKTGITRSVRPASEMAEEARKRPSALDAKEVAAIQAYLIVRAKRYEGPV